LSGKESGKLSNSEKVSILFVCMGNICRSPTAQGVFEQMVEAHGLTHAITVDSAGTHAYHVGERPDERASQAASRRGVDMSRQRARRVSEVDFEVFDLVLAMDHANYEDLGGVCPPGHESKLRLFLDFAPGIAEREVPDPYYGGPGGFERVLDLVEMAAAGLLADIRQQYRL
jgi:protein-tyrosine phosphatase